jgi:hypothetical protein
MVDSICFEFDATIIRDKNTLIPSHETNADLAANISMATLECGCCWSMYLPIKYEYEYREWLNDKDIDIQSVKYINRVHNEIASWLTLYKMETDAMTFLTQLVNSGIHRGSRSDRYVTLKYIVKDRPDSVFTFEKESTYPGIIYNKALELFIETIGNYKDFLSQLGNWGVSNNIFTKAKLLIPEKMFANTIHNSSMANEYKMFDVTINGKTEVKCVACIEY